MCLAGASEPAPMIPFRERARLYGYAVCSFVRQIGPVHLLGEMYGNIGDHLIWAGTAQLLDTHHGLVYEAADVRTASRSRHVAWRNARRARKRRMDGSLARLAPQPRR